MEKDCIFCKIVKGEIPCYKVYEDKNVNYENWSEDAHGRALWSLSFLFKSKSIPRDLKKEAGEILTKGLFFSIPDKEWRDYDGNSVVSGKTILYH